MQLCSGVDFGLEVDTDEREHRPGGKTDGTSKAWLEARPDLAKE